MKKKYIKSIASKLGTSTKHVRPVDRFPGYFVTDCGKVFSCLREKPLRMKSHKSNTGYSGVNLSKEGAVHSVYVHHLVLKNFVGEPPVGFRAHFINKDKDDMALDNLEWRPSTTKAWARYYNKSDRPHIPDDVVQKVMRLSRKKKTKALHRLLADLARR